MQTKYQFKKKQYNGPLDKILPAPGRAIENCSIFAFMFQKGTVWVFTCTLYVSPAKVHQVSFE